MCDLEEKVLSQVISSDVYSEKKKIVQQKSEEYKAEDNIPDIFEKSDTGSVPMKLLQKMSNGFLSPYVDDLKKASSNLNELTRNQNIVIETLEQESARVVESLLMYRMEDMFVRMKHLHVRAQNLKREMLTIHERTLKLKKRAVKLQQLKQKEALQKELQRDRELERDKQLAPKIATKSSEK